MKTILIIGALGALAVIADKQGVTAAAIAAKFIADQEDFSPKPYRDANGYSIGFGHFIQPGEQYLMTATWTKADALAQLAKDMATATAAVNAAVTVPLTNNQRAALISLAYNIGGGAFKGSTLVKRLNAGDYSAAADQFAAWNRSAGRVNDGLVARRAAEKDLFLS